MKDYSYNSTVYNVAVLGGDEREICLINSLIEKGFKVYGIGFDRIGFLTKSKLLTSLHDNNINFDVIILPLPGVNDNGDIPSTHATKKYNFFSETKEIFPMPLVLTGRANENLKNYVNKKNGKLLETINLDEIAIYNSIPTAEGTILKAMKYADITIHGSSSLVLGLGRCGLTLARLLINMGSKVTVAARRASQLARAEEMKAAPIYLTDLEQEIVNFDLVFNTIPTLILNEMIIYQMDSQTVIVDIASGEGGTDFKACRERNIKAILAPGLPGEVAPKTAGEILAKVYPRLIETHLGRLTI